MSTLGLLALITVSVSLLALVPQVLRITRTRVTDGLSAGTIALTLITYTLWCSYGFGINDATQIVNNLLGAAVFCFLAHIIATETGLLRPWHAPAIVAVTATAAAGLTSLSSPMAAAAAGTALGLFTKVPQVRVAVSGAPLWGIDPWAILIGMVSWLLWISYGIAAADPAVVISCLVGGTLHAVVVYYRLPPRRTLRSLADGRLGAHVARAAAPVSARYPYAGPVGPDAMYPPRNDRVLAHA